MIFLALPVNWSVHAGGASYQQKEFKKKEFYMKGNFRTCSQEILWETKIFDTGTGNFISLLLASYVDIQYFKHELKLR
jgi:hypothetical protein